MKKLLSLILLAGVLLLPSAGWSADQKISALTLKVTPTTSDMVAIVNAADLTKTYRALLGAVPLSGNDELKAFATGLLKSTTTTGALTTAVAGTDYQPAPIQSTSLTPAVGVAGAKVYVVKTIT